MSLRDYYIFSHVKKDLEDIVSRSIMQAAAIEHFEGAIYFYNKILIDCCDTCVGVGDYIENTNC